MKQQQKAEWVARLRDEAVAALDRGWNLIPISINSKKPIIKWLDLQSRTLTIDELDDWFDNGVPSASGQRIAPFNLGVVTGSISGILILDCDNEDALKHASKAGWTTPFSVQTTRGRHFYFRHPGHGKRFANKVGGSGRDWPDVIGLDFRGDGGYALMPPSLKLSEGSVVHQYEWEIGAGLDWDDLESFPWRGNPTNVEVSQEEFSFGALDLSSVKVSSPLDGASIYEQTRVRVALLGRKLSDGDGRNNWLVRFAGQKVRAGLTGDDLLLVVGKYMDEFFSDHRDDGEVATVLRSATDMDRRNYPEDYDSSGARKVKAPEPAKPSGLLRPVYSGDVQRLLDTLGDTAYWADPLIAAETITQVVGYNGHGKSFFLAALLTSMAAGRPAFGPYDTPKPAKVFYLDYDNPARTVLHRLGGFNKMFGDTGERFGLWTPTLIPPEEGGEMNLATENGFKTLGNWLDVVDPDILVIDTVRNAFGGMDEASPQEWFKVNHVAKTVRNLHRASVVLVHHRNKPGEGGLGREAGSTAQLTDIDTQVMVTQVFRDKTDAKTKAGLLDSDLNVLDMADREWTPYGYLEQRLEPDSRLKMVSQISFGKVRQQTEMHQTHYIGWAERLMDGSQYVVSTASAKQKAAILSSRGETPENIARKLSMPLYEVRRWVA